MIATGTLTVDDISRYQLEIQSLEKQKNDLKVKLLRMDNEMKLKPSKKISSTIQAEIDVLIRHTDTQKREIEAICESDCASECQEMIVQYSILEKEIQRLNNEKEQKIMQSISLSEEYKRNIDISSAKNRGKLIKYSSELKTMIKSEEKKNKLREANNRGLIPQFLNS